MEKELMDEQLTKIEVVLWFKENFRLAGKNLEDVFKTKEDLNLCVNLFLYGKPVEPLPPAEQELEQIMERTKRFW